MTVEQLKKDIEKLKREKDAVILAHYYTNKEIQEIADYVGDSYYLSKIGKACSQEVIMFCGVKFMGEAAKMLSPEKTVLMPDVQADCPMAHMAEEEDILHIREQYEDVAVVCYINSTAELKAKSDVCVTSSNAVKIVKALPHKHIYFIPDQNLGRYVAKQVPEKHFIFNDGHCHVHTLITKEDVLEQKERYPEAQVLVHPECREEVVELGDYVGSTSGIIEHAAKMPQQVAIVCTEMGILYGLQKAAPDKQFVFPRTLPTCPSMKRMLLEKVHHVLTHFDQRIEVEENVRKQAVKALENMHHYGE
ncbi:MAG: quinolinate synthase NadA [Cellulosilyticaceae bacterium]